MADFLGVYLLSVDTYRGVPSDYTPSPKTPRVKTELLASDAARGLDMGNGVLAMSVRVASTRYLGQSVCMYVHCRYLCGVGTLGSGKYCLLGTLTAQNTTPWKRINGAIWSSP